MLVLVGLVVCVFGLIVVVMVWIWIDYCVDFLDLCNLFLVGVVLVFGVGDFIVDIGGFVFGGIGILIIVVLLLY